MNQQEPAEGIGIIMLAAGSSVRFQSDKRTAQLSSGKTILETTLSQIPASITRKLLVLKPGDDALAEQFTGQWQICFAEAPEHGMANSLASGIRMAEDWSGALIGLGDMPLIKPETYAALRQALASHPIVIPCCHGRRGNPVGFSRRFFPEIGELQGDHGARAVLEKYPSECYELETVDEGILKDIDLPEMLI